MCEYETIIFGSVKLQFSHEKTTPRRLQKKVYKYQVLSIGRGPFNNLNAIFYYLTVNTLFFLNSFPIRVVN